MRSFGTLFIVRPPALSVAAYDFFFVPPRFTFAVADVHHIMTFAVMFAVGTAMGTLVARLRHARQPVARDGRAAAYDGGEGE